MYSLLQLLFVVILKQGCDFALDLILVIVELLTDEPLSIRQEIGAYPLTGSQNGQLPVRLAIVVALLTLVFNELLVLLKDGLWV